MHRILITGGAGFIGANFVHYWHRQHPEDRLVVLDVLTYAGRKENLEPLLGHANLRFVQDDIREQARVEALLRDEQIEVLVHFAAESHVDRSITGPDVFVETNVVGTHALLKAARAVWLEAPGGPRPHRFHHVSTDEVYGSLAPEAPAATEHSPFAPNSPYAASKAAADHLVRAYHRTFGLRTTASHGSNNYGPYQFPEKLIPLTLLHLLLGRPVPLYGDGRNVRDWIYVEDHCRGLERILAQGQEGETYNLGGGNELTNVELVRRLCRLVDEAFAQQPALKERFPEAPAAQGCPSDSLIVQVPDRPGHDRRYSLNSGRLERELSWRPQVALEAGLPRTLEWYLANEAWWRASGTRSSAPSAP